jgi:anti-anti-sigma regulatory factor
VVASNSVNGNIAVRCISPASDVPEPELSVSALEYDRGGPCAVMSLAGRAGIADCAWVHLLLEMQAAQAQGRLVVDLSRLSSMDWWVAMILSWAGRVVSRRGGVLVLASPQPGVARLLDAVGAPRAVATYDGGR